MSETPIISTTKFRTLFDNSDLMPLPELTDTLVEKIYKISEDVIKEMFLGNDPHKDEIMNREEIFRKDIFCIKAWFKRISWANKKLLFFAFLDDMKLVWGFSRFLQTIWKCKTKDAILSSNDIKPWTGFDQVPLDHNRAAAPQAAIDAVTAELRKWFKGLHTDHKVMLLVDLMEMCDGPLQCQVYTRAHAMFMRHRTAVVEDCADKPMMMEIPQQTGPHLNEWVATTKLLRASIKMDEMIMFDKDESTRVWRLGKPKPEHVETIDMIQLLPSIVAKHIFSYIPVSQLPVYSRVNRYWGYIIDELIQENNVRYKIDMELEKLRAQIARHEDTRADEPTLVPDNSNVKTSILESTESTTTTMTAEPRRSMSVPNVQPTTLRKKRVYKPVKCYAKMNERINRRGAADEAFLRYRCTEMLNKKKKDVKRVHHIEREQSGSVSTQRLRIVCPFLQNFDDEDIEQTAEKEAEKRRRRPNMWTLNVSRLYPVVKL